MLIFVTKYYLTRLTYAALRRQATLSARTFGRDSQAQTMVEYALLAGFVAIVGGITLAAAPTTGDNIKVVVNKLIQFLTLAAGAGASSAC